MDVKEIMRKEVHKMPPNTSVKEAAMAMTEKDIGYTLVVDGNKLLGILTEEDIMTKVVVKGRHPQKVPIEEIMVREVVHVTPDMTIEDASKMMTDKGIKKLPVVDGNKLTGIITAIDMIAAEPKMMDNLSELVLFAKKPQKMAG